MRKGHAAGEAKRLGANLRRIRKQHRLSQEQVASRIGVATSTISRTERGEGNPCLDTLIAVAGALDIPVARLFGGEPERSPDALGRSLEQRIRALRQARDVRSLELASAVLDRLETYTP